MQFQPINSKRLIVLIMLTTLACGQFSLGVVTPTPANTYPPDAAITDTASPEDTPAGVVTSTPANTDIPDTAITDTPSPEDTPALGNFFEIIIGQTTFSLSLPEGWNLYGPQQASIGNAAPLVDVYVLGMDAPTSGGPPHSQVLIASAADWTPEFFVESYCGTCPQHEFEEVIVGGKPALRTQIGGGGVPFIKIWYFIELNEKLIIFTINDPDTLAPLDEVIASIHIE